MRLRWSHAVLAAVLAVACTDTYIHDPRRVDNLPADRALALEGKFCTPSTNEVVRPIKIVLAMDASQSMSVTDPDGSRAKALIELMDTLPQDPEIYISVMVFAGSVSAYLTASNQFEQLIAITPADRYLITQRLLNYVAPGNMPNRDSTDFVKPLSEIFALISRDITQTRVAAAGKESETRARYSVIFLSDGQPTNNQDDELLCGDAVRRIRQLKDLADDVRVNTVHVFVPNQPIASSVCNLDGGVQLPANTNQSCGIPLLPPGACPLLQINQNAERLEKMASLGGGDFRDFRNNEPVNFLNFRFGQTRRTFVFDKLVATNFSALPGSPEDGGDTDSDGLKDDDEIRARTNPWVKDTDGDGFSDGVEEHFRRVGGSFTPAGVPLPDGGGLDPGCPPALRGVDADCDGLNDCDEQIIGTNSLRMDSDDDGIADAIEWQMQSQPSGKDLGQDPDNDGLKTGDEVMMHMDPKVVDDSKLTAQAYRYLVQRNGEVDDGGRQCFTFRIDNVSLAYTWPDIRDAGNPDGGAPLFRRGAGYNDLFVTTSMTPGDDPNGRTLIRSYRHQTSRYPVGGIRLPSDGVIRIDTSDFTAGCGQKQTGP
ncbi:MAG: mtsE [Myxococcaceae bacterium]|nr:mtsE [Myxococcaceae bacterium]